MSSFFMDSFTQIVLGVGVAHVTLGNRVGIKKVVLFGAVLGTIPDLDIYIAKFFNDPLTEIEIHRGFSHSITFFLLLSIVLAFLLRNFFKEISQKKLFIATFLVLFTHSLLDIFTTWGTQLFWPFADKIALKSIFVVDLFYTLPLLVGVVMGLSKRRQYFTYIGLLWGVLYLIWGIAVQQFVKNKVQNHFEENYNSKILKITTKPTFSNSFLWNIIVQDASGFYLSDYSIFDSKDVKFQFFPQNNDLLLHINDANINRLKNITENQYTISKENNGFIFNDLRFGLLKNNPNEIQFAFSYRLTPTENGYVVTEIPKNKRDGVQLLKNLWRRLLNQS